MKKAAPEAPDTAPPVAPAEDAALPPAPIKLPEVVPVDPAENYNRLTRDELVAMVDGRKLHPSARTLKKVDLVALLVATPPAAEADLDPANRTKRRYECSHPHCPTWITEAIDVEEATEKYFTRYGVLTSAHKPAVVLLAEEDPEDTNPRTVAGNKTYADAIAAGKTPEQAGEAARRVAYAKTPPAPKPE